MIFKSYMKSYLFRHAFSVALAVFFAVMINRYFAFSKMGWIILAAFLAAQTTRGTPFRQSVIFSITMIVAILMASFLMMTIGPVFSIFVAMMVFLASSYIAFVSQPIQNKTIFRIMLLAFVLLIAVLSPAHSPQLLQYQIIDVIIGAGIGIACGQLIMRVRFDNEFRQGLIPVLRAALQYSQVVTDCFLRRENDVDKLVKKKIVLEESLQAQHGMYPEWVYEVGFNPGLRSGFRFYLVSIERMVEMLFSMDYLASQGINTDLILEVSDLIYSAMQKNAELMSVLIEYFENNKLKDITANFTSDIAELDSAASRAVPGHLELLDISPDYITLTAFVRDVKDLRKLLLQLVMALPTGNRK